MYGSLKICSKILWNIVTVIQEGAESLIYRHTCSFLSSGPPDPNKSVFVRHSSTVVCTAGIPNSLAVEPRDEFNNLCIFRPDENPTEGYNVAVTQVTVYQIYCKVFKFPLFNGKYEYQLAKLCCGLFYYTVSHSDYVTSNGGFIHDGELKRIWEEIVVTQSTVLAFAWRNWVKLQ